MAFALQEHAACSASSASMQQANQQRLYREQGYHRMLSAQMRAFLLGTVAIVATGNPRGRPGMPNKEEKLRRAAEMGEMDNVRNLSE